jgi:hypothetical protein
MALRNLRNENALPMRVYAARPRGESTKTQRYEVVYPDGRVRIKLLTEHGAEILADQGLRVRRVKG